MTPDPSGAASARELLMWLERLWGAHLANANYVRNHPGLSEDTRRFLEAIRPLVERECEREVYAPIIRRLLDEEPGR